MRQTKIHSDCHHHHQVIVFWLAPTGALYVMMWWWWLDVHFCHCHQVIVFMINSSVVSGYYYRPFDSDHHLTITSHLKISLQPHTIHDKIVWSHLGTTWWPPSPTVCSAQLRQSLTSVSVSAECYDSYERLVANSTSVSIVCLRLGTISRCAPFDLLLANKKNHLISNSWSSPSSYETGLQVLRVRPDASWCARQCQPTGCQHLSLW